MQNIIFFVMCALALFACTDAPGLQGKNSSDAKDSSMDTNGPDGSNDGIEFRSCYTDFQCDTIGFICMNQLCLPVGEEDSGGDTCLKVKLGCQIYAAKGDDSVVSTSWWTYRNEYCWNHTEAVMLNVWTNKLDNENVPIWALQGLSKDARGNWCNDEVRNEVIDSSCFSEETPEDLGFTVHCTRDENGFPRTLVWLYQPFP
jgi:hypothetical protein